MWLKTTQSVRLELILRFNNIKILPISKVTRPLCNSPAKAELEHSNRFSAKAKLSLKGLSKEKNQS